jgi:serine/threonine protein kinase
VILDNIGSGSFSKVFRARHRVDNEIYCIKSVFKSRITCRELLTLLIQEIEIGRTVTHHNLCALHYLYEDDKCIYLVMENVLGVTLLDMLSKNNGIAE